MNGMQDLRKQPLEVRLSALLDGEVEQGERQELEQLLSASGEAQDIYERLKHGSELGRAAMDGLLKEPVPLALVREIRHPQGREKPGPRITAKGILRSMRFTPTGPQAVGACILCLVIGGGLGYMLGAQAMALQTPQALAASPAHDWLDDIADSHRVYSRQQRHLAEVPASQAEHITDWLAQSVGVTVIPPDLGADHLTFEGARLLVADGKPVGQLLYRSDENDVIAICFMKSNGEAEAPNETIKDEIGLVSWKKPEAAYVVVGPSSEAALSKIAETVSAGI